MRKMGASDVGEYAEYLTGRVKDEAGYAAPASTRSSQGDYYLGTPGEPNAEPLGVWGGRGAERIGLSGTVESEQLVRVWQGQDPITGDLVIRPGPDGEHVAAIDMVASVPKSVSIAWAVCQDAQWRGRIEAAVTRATEATMAILEQDCPLVARRIGGEMHREPAAGLVWSRFRHHTARTTEAQTARGDGADPDLHDHVVLANYAVRRDGTVGAIDGYAAMRAQRLFTQLHYTQLAHEMRRMGYDTVPVRDHFELAGVSQEEIDEFSNRSIAIDEAVADFRAKYHRHPTPAEHQELVRETRRGKDETPFGDRERWLSREAAIEPLSQPNGISAGTAPPLTGVEPSTERARLRDARGETDEAPRPSAQLLGEVVGEITTGDRRLSRDDAVFDTLELHQAAARALVRGGGADLEQQWHVIRDGVEASPELVRHDREHWSTRRHQELEEGVLASARAKAAPVNLAVEIDPARVEWHIAHAAVALDLEQQEAVRRLCAPSGLALTLAEAGTGKGALARVVADVYREAGCRVIATSTSAQRAQEFGRDLGADEATSIDALYHSTARFGLGPRTLVLADEVGQVDTYRWARLFQAAGTAPVRGFGDTEQLDSVEAGGMLRLFDRELGTIPLSTVYRTRDQELIALWRQVRQGDRAAVEELSRRGAFVFEDSLPDSRERAIERWDADRVAQGRPMGEHLVATNISNRQVDQLNALAQQRRRERGEIGGAAAEVTFLDRAKDYRRTERLHVGDQVRLVASGKLGGLSGRTEHVRNGQSGRVVAIGDDGQVVVEIDGRREFHRQRLAEREQASRARFEQGAAARWQGFEREQQAARARYLERGIPEARIEEWQRSARERFELRQAALRATFETRWEGERAAFLAEDERGSVRFEAKDLPLLRLGYAGHDQTTQGRTSQTIDALIGREATDRQHAYVELSRAREDARFHVALDQWRIPRERVIVEAGAEGPPRVEAIPWDERVELAKAKIAEAFERDRPKVSAIEFRAQALAAFAEAETERLVREREALARATQQPATPRQLACARATGADVPEGATWVQASVAIETARGEEPGTFARQALSARHAPEHVAEVVAAAVDRQLARAFEPAMETDAELPEEPTAAARLAEEVSGSERGRSDVDRGTAARAGDTGRSGRGDPRSGLTGDRDGSVNAPDDPKTLSAATEDPEPVAEPVPPRLTTAELEAAEKAHLAEVEPARVDRQALAATPSPTPDLPEDPVAAEPVAAEVDQAPAPEPEARWTQDDQPPMEAQQAAQEAREPEQSAQRQAEAEAVRQAAEERAAQAELEAEQAAEREAQAEIEAASQRKVESDRQADEAQPEPEPKPTPEPLGAEWSYDLWAEPTDDRDDDRRAGRGMGMEM